MLNLTGFETHMRAEGAAESTIKGYIADLKTLGATGDEDRDGIAVLLAGMRERGVSSATVHRRAMALRRYFAYAKPDEKNPMDGFKIKVKTTFDPVYLSLDELERLERTIRNSDDMFRFRDLAMVTIMGRRGLRVGEIVSLNAEDVEVAAVDLVILTVVTKGGRRERKTLDQVTSFALRKWIDHRADLVRYRMAKALPIDKALFWSMNGDRISRRRIETLIPWWCDQAGINKDVTPHSLRHTFATIFLKNTGDVALLSRALGHAGVGVTMRYTHLGDDDVAAAMRKE